MYIKTLRIQNFRGIKGLTINLQPGVNILIGPLNVGKSTILAAVDLVLGAHRTWWRRDVLTELDFHRCDTTKPITIELDIGCGRAACGDDCPRFQVAGAGPAEVCRLQDYLVLWDPRGKKFLKVDDFEGKPDHECAVRVRATSIFNKDEGWADTNFEVLNEDGQPWTQSPTFTTPMKEWVGCLLLRAPRDPQAECSLKRYSLLSRALGDTAAWEREMHQQFRTRLKDLLSALSGRPALRALTERVASMSRGVGATLGLTLEGANKWDVVRQVQLSQQKGADLDLPLSSEGAGAQNLASLALAALALERPKQGRPPASILMVEEPEQNLDPQSQCAVARSILQLASRHPDGPPPRVETRQSLETQVIISTHSPHILSTDTHLRSVIRLSAGPQGDTLATALGEVDVDGKRFFDVRKYVDYDSELYQALFGDIIVVWEGDSEAGFYPTLMRSMARYPADALPGITGGGDKLKIICQWFRAAGYSLVAVIDGDQGKCEDLHQQHIPFIALAPGTCIEDVVAARLHCLDPEETARILLAAIGALGTVSRRNDFAASWPALHSAFAQRHATEVPTSNLLEQHLDPPPEPKQTADVLRKAAKKKWAYEALAEHLFQAKAVPDTCLFVIQRLRSFLRKQSTLGPFQFDGKGLLRPYHAQNENLG